MSVAPVTMNDVYIDTGVAYLNACEYIVSELVCLLIVNHGKCACLAGVTIELKIDRPVDMDKITDMVQPNKAVYHYTLMLVNCLTILGWKKPTYAPFVNFSG